MKNELGHLHPLTIATKNIYTIFSELKFEVASGPEVEEEFYNFDALNVPSDHPARDMQDTFWIEPLPERKLLRTHTSPVQVRYMQKHTPPFRIIVPGKVYRNEATDATHEAQFFQIEGLVVEKEISMAHLKGTLETFFKKFFGSDMAVRFRPSFFPFVEPGAEIDVSCFKCSGKGCNVCKGTGWIEVMGAGMVHPHVLRAGGVDSDMWRGFAFGGGIDRLVMLKYGVEDVRHLFTGDLRLVAQF
jgi:phenylalanyl-tRNA synthetase alpha chain